MSGKKRNWKDFGSSLFLIALGLFMIFESRHFEIWSPEGPKAGFFPIAVAIVIMGASITIMVESLSSKQIGEGSSLSAVQEKGETAPLRAFFYILLIFLYGLSVDSGGFYFATMLYLIAVLKFVEKQQWETTIMIAALCTVANWLLFGIWLKVPLPMGFMRDWFSF